MKKYSIFLIGLLCSCFVVTAQNYRQADEPVTLEEFSQYDCVPGDILVKFADFTDLRLNNLRGRMQTGINAVDSLLQNYTVTAIERLCPTEKPKSVKKTAHCYNGEDVTDYDLSRLCILRIADTLRQFELIEQLKSLDAVEFAEPNYIVHALGESVNTESEQEAYLVNGRNRSRNGSTYFNPDAYTSEPMYAMQWGIHTVGLDSLWAADTNSSTNRSVIAVLDTGVDPEHPDLAANMWHNPNETRNGFDDDYNGFVDDTLGWDFVNQRALMRDNNSHGTHCAGIAAAVGNNGIGIAGANPNALIMPITVLQSNGSGNIATIVQGINYAKNNGADVLSMSFGTYTYSYALEQALAQAYHSSVLVAAAGNDAKKLPDAPMYPAAFTFVLGVQATMQSVCPNRPLGMLACYSNCDLDGPASSTFGEEQLYNYELCAPGSNMLSTVPNGMYRTYTGTSMACPLVAGGISALMHAKTYLSQEILWGDLINTGTQMGLLRLVNFDSCYHAGPAPAQLELVAVEVVDTVANFGDGDGRPDAGEILDIYPTLRTTWGATDSIVCWLEFSEFEDTNTVHRLHNQVDFGYPLSAYAKSKALNPLRVQIDSNVVNGRVICLYLCAYSPNAQDTLRSYWELTVENGVEIGGVLTEDMVLYPNINYTVTEDLVIPSSLSLIIKPGTTLKLADNVSIVAIGRLYAVGKPDSMITFTKTDLGHLWGGIYLESIDTLQYCVIEYSSHTPLTIKRQGNFLEIYTCYVSDLIIKNNVIDMEAGFGRTDFFWLINRSNIYNNKIFGIVYSPFELNSLYVNLVDNSYGWGHEYYCNSDCGFISCRGYYNVPFKKMHIFNNTPGDDGAQKQLITNTSYIYDLSQVYLGTSREAVARQYIWDLETPNSGTYGWINLDNMQTRPHAGCHGIVWKILCNGYDAQDAYDSIIPLGPGRHRFDIYYNRAVDTSVAPSVSMGARTPYTQHAINQDGSWSADSTIYTVYIDINPAQVTDGINRICVSGGRDNELFEIPEEKLRFNVPVSTAGSLSAGFMATPGFGKIDLEWNYNDAVFEDILGYDIYRYRLDSANHYVDTTVINSTLILDTLYTDNAVVPGQRYFYYYKMLRTDFSETNISRVVSAVPLSATLGDANGSFTVDVADVVAIISYMAGQNPSPFIFTAADVNRDGVINVLDVVAVINLIVNGNLTQTRGSCETATYNIEDGILYVNSPVDLAGVQINFIMDRNNSIQPLEVFNGFEQVSTWVSDSNYMFLAYSMSGQTISAGSHPLLSIGNAAIADIVLSDPNGCNIVAMDVTQPEGIVNHDFQMQMKSPYPNPFNHTIHIPYIIGNESVDNVEFVVTDLMGKIIELIPQGNQVRGSYSYTWVPQKSLHNGIYFIQMRANGMAVQTSKVIYFK